MYPWLTRLADISDGNSTTYVLPQFIIASSDIITLADKNYYRFTTLGTPQDIYHVKTPFGVVKDVIVSRATSTVLRQQGITKKEAQHCQNFLRELPVETMTQEIADAFGCPEAEAKEYLSSFLSSAEAYLDESDMDVGTLTAAFICEMAFMGKPEPATVVPEKSGKKR